MKPSSIFAIILLYLLGLTSCTQPSSSNLDSTILETDSNGSIQSPLKYNIIYDKNVFQFTDKQNVILDMKLRVDSIMLSRTTIFHSDSTQRQFNHFGEWVVPADKLIDTTYQEIKGLDTMTFIREVRVYPSNSFILKR